MWPISGGVYTQSNPWNHVGALFGQAGISSGGISSCSPQVLTMGLPAASGPFLCISSKAKPVMTKLHIGACFRSFPPVLTNAIPHNTAAKTIFEACYIVLVAIPPCCLSFALLFLTAANARSLPPCLLPSQNLVPCRATIAPLVGC